MASARWRNLASLARIASSALNRSVMSMAIPPTSPASPSGPGIGNLLTSEWWTVPSPCSRVSTTCTPAPASSARRSFSRNWAAVSGGKTSSSSRP